MDVYDQYELDSFHKELGDFMNNLDIALEKLNSMIEEIKGITEEGFILDYCEQILMKHLEVTQNL